MALLVSGGSDGVLVLWSADYSHDSRELVPKLSLKAHDGGVIAVERSHVVGAPPQLITIGADKTLAIWDTMTAIEHPMYAAIARPLCELSSLLPPQVLASRKKLKVYSMVAHSLQSHLVATGTNVGVLVCEFDAQSLPPVAPLLTAPGSREHAAVCVVKRELKLLQFQLLNTPNPAIGGNGSSNDGGRVRGDTPEQLHLKQIKKHISVVPHDSYSVLSVSSSGKYLAIVWPDIPYFSVYKVSDWSIVDSGSARLLAWDTCRDRFALLESALPPRMPVIPKGSSSRKAKGAAAAAAQAAATAASMASSASVQVRILLDDGTSNILMRSVGSRSDPVSCLDGGSLLGIAYRISRRISPIITSGYSTFQSAPPSGHGSSSHSSFSSMDDGYSSQKSSAEAAPPNFQLYSWETFQPVGGLLPQPEWTAWDRTVEYCAFGYQLYIAISSLRPQFRYLGDVAIPYATGAVWHRRQLFVATQTTIECVFVDAGVAPIDIETKRRKEEMRLKEAQSKAVAEHGELAFITVDSQQSTSQERITLRPPMLQVVRLASFQHVPSVPPFLTLPKQSTVDRDDSPIPKEFEERKVNEVAVGGGGVAVAVTRFPAEQKRPVGPLVLAGVRDGALWLIDRYMCAHAISLSHPGIRCRCLAAYGDAVSAVKWASRLGREHHDDLAQFMLGMGYATEALHLPGISKRLEFDLAMQSNDLKRALHCLLTMSNSRDIGQEALGLNLNDIMNLSSKKENVVDAVQGVAKFAKEFLHLIDAADATGQADIASEALKRLAAAGSVKGALQGHELRGLALRQGNHGELTRLSNLVNNLVSVGSGREAAFAAALLGDNVLMEKAWQETGMLAEAVLHAHAHGRPTLRGLVQAWNKTLQKDLEHTPSTKMDAATAFLASLEESKITSLQDSAKKPPIEILPPGMASLYGPNPGQSGPKKPGPPLQSSQPQPAKPLALEGPAATPQNASTFAESGAPPPAESGALPPAESGAPQNSDASAPATSESVAPVDPPTSEPATTNSESGAPSEPEQDASTPPATESSDPAPLPSSDAAVENKEQALSASSVPAPTGTEESDPPASVSSPITTDAGPQQSNNHGTGVRAELSMIDFT
ncbi:UNVERIFIED_CONTAM: TSET complex member tstF [Sesamum radiatum]|uniref:TSET complex member tstF n=1 Tax=Sesamum radiatum TaxID=300843 RepID=A0AAW2MXQ8_SESRA